MLTASRLAEIEREVNAGCSPVDFYHELVEHARATLPMDETRIREVVLARLTGPDPDTGETYETEGWSFDVELVPADIDPDDGELYAHEYARVTAQDLGHRSNVLTITVNHRYEIEEIA